jgi:hypothetical protein
MLKTANVPGLCQLGLSSLFMPANLSCRTGPRGFSVPRLRGLPATSIACRA